MILWLRDLHLVPFSLESCSDTVGFEFYTTLRVAEPAHATAPAPGDGLLPSASEHAVVRAKLQRVLEGRSWKLTGPFRSLNPLRDPGELARGAGRGVRDFVLVSIGTGLGMGVVIDGRLHRGASGLAGEVGYLPTAGAEHVDAATGQLRGQGAMERLVSTHAVIELAKESGLQHATSAAGVIDAARAGGDPAALRVVAAIAARLAVCIASVAAVLDPGLIILGGGIGTGAGPLLLDPLRRNLAAISPLRPRLGMSERGSGAVVDGAVTEALGRVVERIFDVDGASAPVISAQGAQR